MECAAPRVPSFIRSGEHLARPTHVHRAADHRGLARKALPYPVVTQPLCGGCLHAQLIDYLANGCNEAAQHLIYNTITSFSGVGRARLTKCGRFVLGGVYSDLHPHSLCLASGRSPANSCLMTLGEKLQTIRRERELSQEAIGRPSSRPPAGSNWRTNSVLPARNCSKNWWPGW